WLFIAHGCSDPSTVFQKEKIAEKGSRRFAKPLLAVSHPNIRGTANGFFGAIIEIVAERRSDLRLEFHRGHELAFGDHNQVPFLLGAIIARQFQRRASFYVKFL